MNIAVKAALLCGGAALFIGAVAGSGSNKSSASVQPQLPNDQAQFVKAVSSARTAFSGAPNELAAGGVRSSRMNAICNAVINQAASDWYGKVTKMTSNGDGKGVLSISVAPDVQVSTWNNALSDIGDNTLIDPSSSMFKTISTLKVGDWVKFSGRFSSSKVDCVKEQSVTIRGSMTDPAFVMRFSSVKKAS
jgi:hypothetical protein